MPTIIDFLSLALCHNRARKQKAALNNAAFRVKDLKNLFMCSITTNELLYRLSYTGFF